MSNDNMTIIYGSTVDYQDEYTDGFQAFWAGKTQRSNPFKQNPNSNQFKMWKMGLENAKRVNRDGATFGLDYEKMKAQYKSRHTNK